jgi:hypothetical protein
MRLYDRKISNSLNKTYKKVSQTKKNEFKSIKEKSCVE